MKTLEELKELGCIPKNVVECKNYHATTVSEFGNFSAEEKEGVNAVILDNSIWVATPDRKSPVRADAVYSYDGEHFGFFNRQNYKFSINELVNDSLIAVKILNIKEDSRMSEINMDNGFEAALNEEVGKPVKMDLGDNAPKAAMTPQEKAQKKAANDAAKARKQQELANEVNKIKNLGMGSNFKIDPKFIDNNQKKGRLLGFFTMTDPVVKVSLKQTPINTGTDAAPHYQLRAGVQLDAEHQERFKNGAKKIEAKYLECKTDVVFKEAAPSQIVAGVVKTPFITEITHESELDGQKTWTADCAEDTTTSFRVLPKEALYAYLELNYNKRIKEDESIPNHTTLVVRSSAVTSKSAKPMGSSAAKPVYRTRIVADGSRPVLVHGNYFPLNTFRTVLLAGASEEEKVLANNNFAALIKQYESSKMPKKDGTLPVPKGDFSDEAKALFQEDTAKSNPSTGLYVCTSSIVNQGAAIQCKPFGTSAKSEVMMEVTALPVRVAKETKDKTQVRYAYEKVSYKESALTDPKYADIIARITAAAEVNDFSVIADKAVAQKRASRSGSSTGTKVASDLVSGLEMLSARANTNAKFDSAMSMAEIFDAFNNAGI